MRSRPEGLPAPRVDPAARCTNLFQVLRRAGRHHAAADDIRYHLALIRTKPITSSGDDADDEGSRGGDPVSKYIPAFPQLKVGVVPDGEWHPRLKLLPPNGAVTIGGSLRHTSGITYDYIARPDQAAYCGAHIFEGHFDNRDLPNAWPSCMARRPARFGANGHSTDVIGRIIEIISGNRSFIPAGTDSDPLA